MPEWSWLALLCLAPTLLPDTLQSALEYRRDAVLAGELWRLVTGHWVHHGWHHAAVDGAALALLAYLLRLAAHARAPLFLAPGSVAISLVLLVASPQMETYRGASGLVLLLAGLLAATLWRTRPRWRLGILLACAVVATKLVADASGLFPAWTRLPPGVQLAWQAHVAVFVLVVVAGCLPFARRG